MFQAPTEQKRMKCHCTVGFRAFAMARKITVSYISAVLSSELLTRTETGLCQKDDAYLERQPLTLPALQQVDSASTMNHLSILLPS